MDRLLHVHFVIVVVLQEVVGEVHGKLKAQHIFFEGHEVHIDLRDLVLHDKVILTQNLFALKRFAGDEENVYILLLSLLPVIALVDDLVDGVSVRAHNEDDGLVLRLEHPFV